MTGPLGVLPADLAAATTEVGDVDGGPLGGVLLAGLTAATTEVGDVDGGPAITEVGDVDGGPLGGAAGRFDSGHH
jgi:hypothetical protein